MNDRTARRHLHKAGITRPRQAVLRPPDAELREVYRALVAEHGERHATGELAKRYGAHFTTAQNWLTAAGLHTVTARTAPKRPITDPCPCGAKATTRYMDQDPALCFTCYMRTWAKGPKFRRAARLFIAEAKRDARCADCGGKFPSCCMHFDHVPGRGPKLFNPGSGDYSLEAVKAEMTKCDIVCANCHAIRTWISRGKSLDDVV